MFPKNLQPSLRFAVAQLSLVLIIACATIAVVLFRQHAQISTVLETRLANMREVDALHESLVDLAALLADGVDNVVAVQDRIEGHLSSLEANLRGGPAAPQLSIVEDHFQRYLDAHTAVPLANLDQRETLRVDALHIVDQKATLACQILRQDLHKEMQGALVVHDHLLSQLAWGLVGVIGTGTLAGALLGFVAQQRLKTSIRKLQIGVLDAAWALKHKMPTLVLTQEGNLDELHDQMQGLVPQIEQLVHDLQQREEEVVRAKQLAGVGRLAAGVAHELRNPLTAIKILVQLGIENKSGPTISQEDLTIIEAEVRRMEGVLQRFMDLAKPQKSEWKAFDFRGTVDHVAGLIRGRAEKQHVSVVVPLVENPLPYFGDQEQMKQVIINLAFNALDAMPAGGTLEFNLQSAANQTLELRVRDTGPGIAPEILDRLFEPFVSSKETGLGLGLPVSRRIVEAHQGTLTAANLPAGGAEFLLTLPHTYKPSLPTSSR